MKRFLFCLINILFVHSLLAQHFQDITQITGLSHVENTNGVAVADYDKDGDLDVFFTGIDNFDPNDAATWSRLLANNNDGTFTDVTIQAGFDIQYVNYGIPAERGEKMGAAWGDYDNDGFPDLFLANSREDQLYHNNGNGTFTDVTSTAGVAGCNLCYSASGTWWDHDRDGDLDLYVSLVNNANIMYLNNGDGTFTDITDLLNIGGDKMITWTAVAMDVGKDGFLDLWNINDTQMNEFFENRSGQHYNEACRAYRLDDEGAGMGVTVGDYNNDGFFDMYVTNIYDHHPNPLFQNTGNRKFEDKAADFGVENTGWSWGTHFFDYDHDTDEDLAVVNGPIDKLHGNDQTDIDNFFFQNMLVEETMYFKDQSIETGFIGTAKSKGLEVFDYDNDGDLDLLVANMNDIPYFFNNTTNEEQANNKNWLQIQLEGTTSNRDGFGTEIRIIIGDKSYYRFHHGAGVFGQSIKPVHFGVAEATIIDEIQISWLSGRTEAIYNIPVNQILHFVEGTGTEIERELPERTFEGAIIEETYNYPNPFENNTTLYIKLANEGDIHLEIFSSLGQKIFDSITTLEYPGEIEIPVDMQTLQNGVYYYIIQTNGKRITGKMIKTK